MSQIIDTVIGPRIPKDQARITLAKQINLFLDDATHQSFKASCVKIGLSMREWLERQISNFISEGALNEKEDQERRAIKALVEAGFDPQKLESHEEAGGETGSSGEGID